jgi:ketosteroid isomerase-like protein
MVLVIFTLNACKYFDKKKPAPLNIEEERMKMLDADRAFSKLSVEKGMRNAFLEFIDSNGVLLRPNELPLVGGDAVDFLTRLNDTKYTLTWNPKNGRIAHSGDLGYTYGIYTLKPSDADTVLYGTYVSIWKKQIDGKWKFVLDSGNDGIGLEEEGQ